MQVPEGCGSHQEFVAQLVALEHSEAALDTMSLAVEIVAPEGEGMYVLRLTDSSGVRELQDTNCQTLFRTAVVIAAAALPDEPGPAQGIAPAPAPTSVSDKATTQPASDVGARLSDAPEQQPRGSLPAQTASLQPERGAVEDSDERGSAIDIGPELHLGAGAVIGSTSELSFAGEAGAAIAWNRWAVSMLVRYLPQSTSTAAENVEMRAQVWSGRVAAGYDATNRLHCSAGVSVHRILAQAVGIRHPESDSVWFVAPELEVSLELARLGDWRGELALQGRVALNTPRFELDPGRSVVFAVPRVGGSGFFRIKWAP